MRRFDWLRDVFESTVGLGAGSLTILLFLREFLDLTIGDTLRIGILIALAGLYVGISALESDLEDTIDGLQSELDKGFNTVVALIENQQEETDVRTDGAGETVPVNTPTVDGPSGNGALGGMIAGGALGLPFGTVGAVVGGVLGGLIGNEIEYRNLKEREQEKLKRAAASYLRYRTDVRTEDVELVEITGPGNTDDDRWRFQYREITSNREHLLELDPEAGTWRYEAGDPCYEPSDP